MKLSPIKSSKDYKNKKLIGNDGNMWISKPNINNIYRWTRFKETKYVPEKFSYKIYILDNGNIPFIVYINNNTAYIVNNKQSSLILEIKFLNKFIGGKRSSVLLEIDVNKYMFISDSIYEFKTKSRIIKFKSMIGKSEMVYAFARDNDNTYYLSFKEYIENKNIENYKSSKNLYDDYFKLFNNSNKYEQKEYFKKIKLKILVNKQFKKKI